MRIVRTRPGGLALPGWLALLLLPLLGACESEYITVLRNDSGAPVLVRLAKRTAGLAAVADYRGLVPGADTCCTFYPGAGRLNLVCRMQPTQEMWLGNERKLFDFGSPLEWDAITVETSGKSPTVMLITAHTVGNLVSEHRRHRSCGDCGPEEIYNIIAIK